MRTALQVGLEITTQLLKFKNLWYLFSVFFEVFQCIFRFCFVDCFTGKFMLFYLHLYQSMMILLMILALTIIEKAHSNPIGGKPQVCG